MRRAAKACLWGSLAAWTSWNNEMLFRCLGLPQSVAAPGSVTDRRAARSLRERAGFTPRQNDINEACTCVQAGATQFSCFRFPLQYWLLVATQLLLASSRITRLVMGQEHRGRLGTHTAPTRMNTKPRLVENLSTFFAPQAPQRLSLRHEAPARQAGGAWLII